jgi:hypothetical protein
MKPVRNALRFGRGSFRSCIACTGIVDQRFDHTSSTAADVRVHRKRVCTPCAIDDVNPTTMTGQRPVANTLRGTAHQRYH